MELIDDSAEDIFSPATNNGLNNLFGQGNANSDLKYQAPKKPSEEKPKESKTPQHTVWKPSKIVSYTASNIKK